MRKSHNIISGTVIFICQIFVICIHPTCNAKANPTPTSTTEKASNNKKILFIPSPKNYLINYWIENYLKISESKCLLTWLKAQLITVKLKKENSLELIQTKQI